MTAKPTARILHGTPQTLQRLARALRRGELVAVPTETVYGLAADALNARACQQIFAVKGRPVHDPLIVHIHSLRQLEQLAEVNDAALKLARKFWPGALTLVLPKKTIVPDVVSAGLPSVGVRMPSHPLFRRLLKLAGTPLAAPSANPFGYVSPTSAAHVQSGLGGRVKHILDGGPSSIGLESTIVDLRDPAKPRLLRPGAVTRVELERTLRRKLLRAKPSTTTAAQVAPGMLASHYSPRTRVTLHTRISLRDIRAGSARDAWVFRARPKTLRAANVFWLDDEGDLRGSARALFSMLRRLDDGRFTTIHVERAEGEGLAEAINDRLRRAAVRK